MRTMRGKTKKHQWREGTAPTTPSRGGTRCLTSLGAGTIRPGGAWWEEGMTIEGEVEDVCPRWSRQCRGCHTPCAAVVVVVVIIICHRGGGHCKRGTVSADADLDAGPR